MNSIPQRTNKKTYSPYGRKYETHSLSERYKIITDIKQCEKERLYKVPHTFNTETKTGFKSRAPRTPVYEFERQYVAECYAEEFTKCIKLVENKDGTLTTNAIHVTFTADEELYKDINAIEVEGLHFQHLKAYNRTLKTRHKPCKEAYELLRAWLLFHHWFTQQLPAIKRALKISQYILTFEANDRLFPHVHLYAILKNPITCKKKKNTNELEYKAPADYVKKAQAKWEYGNICISPSHNRNHHNYVLRKRSMRGKEVKDKTLQVCTTYFMLMCGYPSITGSEIPQLKKRVKEKRAKAVALYYENKEKNKAITASEYIAYSRHLSKQGKYLEAERQARKARALEPGNTVAKEVQSIALLILKIREFTKLITKFRPGRKPLKLCDTTKRVYAFALREEIELLKKHKPHQYHHKTIE